MKCVLQKWDASLTGIKTGEIRKSEFEMIIEVCVYIKIERVVCFISTNNFSIQKC